MTPWLYIDARYERLEPALHDAIERTSLQRQLPGYLHTQRWFGGQARTVVEVTLERWVELETTGACICVVLVGDSVGVRTEHQLYLIVGPEEEGQRPVLDALELGEVRAELLALVLSGARREGYRAELVCEGGPDQPEGCRGEGRLVGVEQSNSSIIYDDACILKVYRRLEHGENPDLQLGRYLSGEAGFPGVPALLASARLESADGFNTTALMLQQYVPNEGDGWAWALEAAARAMSGAGGPENLPEWLHNERSSLGGAATLGETTARLHVALASASGEGMQPQTVTDEDLDAWGEDLRQEAREAARAMVQTEMQAPDLADAIQRVAEASERPAGMAAGGAGLKMRVHGDYHLGQVLRTSTGFVVLDFEGEPARPLLERRVLQHPLVDVAGMVRSWSYAAHTAAQRAGTPEMASPWEQAMREEFLASYFRTAESASPEFLSADSAVRSGLLGLFELRKALYEVRYELNNRPDWVDIPASAVRRLAEERGD